MWGAIAGAAGGMLGSDPVMNAGPNYSNWLAGKWAAGEQNYQQNLMMDKQNSFSQSMANTAHQREVLDLEAAGLNPILSSGGSGAPSPSGAGGSAVGAPALQFPAVHAVPGIGDLLMTQQKIDIDRARAVADIEKVKAETGKVGVDNQLTKAQTTLAGKGSIMAGLEARGGGIINDTLDWISKKWNSPSTPTQQYDQGMAYGEQ